MAKLGAWLGDTSFSEPIINIETKLNIVAEDWFRETVLNN